MHQPHKQLLSAYLALCSTTLALPQVATGPEIQPLPDQPAASSSASGNTTLDATRIRCEQDQRLRPLKADCLTCLEDVFPAGDKLGYFHHDLPNDGFRLPNHGFQCGSCKLYPHLLNLEQPVVSSWDEIGDTLDKIVKDCAKKERDWEDVSTGGQVMIGPGNGIIVDVINFSIGEEGEGVAKDVASA